MSPHETWFLENTTSLEVTDISNNAFVQLKILDFPGGYEFSDKKLPPESIFKKDASIVFVIDQTDGQDDLTAVEHFLDVSRLAHGVNPNLDIDILIHKVEAEAETYHHDDLNERVRQIRQVIIEQLREERLNIHPTFHLTSIHNHTIFEAFSKIVQKRIPQMNQLEKLLSGLALSCRVEKAYVFDVISKIYVATDNSDMDQFYEICSNAIDVVIDVSRIYSIDKDSKEAKAKSNENAPVPFDAKSGAMMRMENDYVLHLREVDSYLALVCLMKTNADINSGLLEYNFACFKKALKDLKVRSVPMQVKLRSNSKTVTSSRGTSARGTKSREEKKT
eukprot:CAMPEP_0167750118 /NCGR_PEP_ID=MMETSP0110_2-20121227/5805_1 /TAXON_ID=629695 /ORGANISM="Gymnochlora sp., Strain CCMP2014" /LENGTH=333 /DNA_ID=CAMNT_0007635387 /DNA_START=107 /DNA_END=1108 /DNA_ORIENTATION=-